MNKLFEITVSEAQQAFVSQNYELTLNKCRLAYTLNPNAVGMYALAGNACLVMKRTEEAERFFRKAVALDSKNGEYHFLLGNSLLTQNRLQEALTCYANAERNKCSDTTRKKLYYVMGKVNQKLGKAQEALISYKKAEAFQGANEDLADILLNKTEIYVAQRNWDEAENCATQLKLLLPGQFKSYQLLFQILLQQKKIEQAQKALDEAERYCSASSENRVEFLFDHTMIHCFLADQEPGNMRKHFQDASCWLDKLDAMPGLPTDVRTEVRLTRTEMLMKLNRWHDAMKMAKPVADSVDATLLEYIEKARFIMIDCCKKSGDMQILSHYAVLLKNSKNLLYRHHGYYNEFWAIHQMSQNDSGLVRKASDLYDRAIAYYKKSSVENPGDLLAYVYRAQVYADAGRFDQAEKLSELLPAEARTQLITHINNIRSAKK